MQKSTKAKKKTANQTATGQKPDKATPEKAEQKHAQPDMMRTQMSGTRPAPTKLPLNREKREQLIQYWRSKGWTYDQITAKFEAGVTEAEYEEYKKRWEA